MKPTITQALKGAAISAAIAVVLNHIWNQIATNVLSAQSVPGPWLLMLTLSSIIPLLLGGLVYFLLEKYTSNGTKIFIGLALVLTVFSIFGNFKPTLPDGTPTPYHFALLTVPMHFIAGLSAALGIPKFSK